MRSIYLIDYIGVHCGMHYYLESFKDSLNNENSQVVILSNYSDSEDEPFFKNHYRGNTIKKICNLVRNYLKLKNFKKAHKKDIIIYLSYGNIIDIPFLKLVSSFPNHVIDIHEAIAQNVDSNRYLKKYFKHIYRNYIKTVISHSSRTDKFLNEYGFKGYCFKVPHFKYKFPREYDINFIPNEIVSSIDKEKINLLFFGNLNESKGVDILIDAVNKLPDKHNEKVNIIIAGKDFDGAVDRVKPLEDRHIKIFKRHITDDELRFLYQNVDYIALPYRKTSQSGILEMAFYFKRPIIASNVDYFRNTLNEFPSFGILSGNDSFSYAKTLEIIIDDYKPSDFFLEKDYEKYENRKEISVFKEDFQNWLSRIYADV